MVIAPTKLFLYAQAPVRSAHSSNLLANVEAVACVERLERATHTESFSDGSIQVSNSVAFAILKPQQSDTLMFVHSYGLAHPRIGTRPLLLGDCVEFKLPKNWQNKDLSLYELQSLRFKD